MTREEFDRVWAASTRLMKIGFETGRIVGVEPEEAARLGDPNRRRFVYNQRQCLVCEGPVSNWDEASRTVWACLGCQRTNNAIHRAHVHVEDSVSVAREPSSKGKTGKKGKKGQHVRSKPVFRSHCAPEPFAVRRKESAKLSVGELKDELRRLGYATTGKKPELVARFSTHLHDMAEHTADLDGAAVGGEGGQSWHGYHHKLMAGSEAGATEVGAEAEAAEAGMADIAGKTGPGNLLADSNLAASSFEDMVDRASRRSTNATASTPDGGGKRRQGTKRSGTDKPPATAGKARRVGAGSSGSQRLRSLKHLT